MEWFFEDDIFEVGDFFGWYVIEVVYVFVFVDIWYVMIGGVCGDIECCFFWYVFWIIFDVLE